MRPDVFHLKPKVLSRLMPHVLSVFAADGPETDLCSSLRKRLCGSSQINNWRFHTTGNALMAEVVYVFA